jgi:hypothetical protein
MTAKAVVKILLTIGEVVNAYNRTYKPDAFDEVVLTVWRSSRHCPDAWNRYCQSLNLTQAERVRIASKEYRAQHPTFIICS